MKLFHLSRLGSELIRIGSEVSDPDTSGSAPCEKALTHVNNVVKRPTPMPTISVSVSDEIYSALYTRALETGRKVGSLAAEILRHDAGTHALPGVLAALAAAGPGAWVDGAKLPAPVGMLSAWAAAGQLRRRNASSGGMTGGPPLRMWYEFALPL